MNLETTFLNQLLFLSRAWWVKHGMLLWKAASINWLNHCVVPAREIRLICLLSLNGVTQFLDKDCLYNKTTLTCMRLCVIKSIHPYPGNNANDIIMSMMASQTTSISIVYSTICWDADQRKHQNSALLAFFFRGLHWWLVNSTHKELVIWKSFHLMMSSWSTVPIVWYHLHYCNHIWRYIETCSNVSKVIFKNIPLKLIWILTQTSLEVLMVW